DYYCQSYDVSLSAVLF
nr:immunoglobulin light chain junction region [Macaca mulatta]MOW56672.1 immunoglobulin light chain junction region [Macaca mulatta]MOW57672.1 immunoglobulin light chain junction region [Macaca mulatta]MOW58036.1 immunoglobulin light chain junction region [Macaca mulatta]MOW59452.1 immunoglobulin light chain junction region [Macaca mulatta]